MKGVVEGGCGFELGDCISLYRLIAPRRGYLGLSELNERERGVGWLKSQKVESGGIEVSFALVGRVVDCVGRGGQL